VVPISLHWDQTPPRGLAAPERRKQPRTRRSREPPTDAEIESGLRERAVTDPRAAEILLRWMQRPRQMAEDDGLEALSIEQLEALHAALMRLSSMDPGELRALVQAGIDRRV
jgi:hypothetical protein